VLEVEGGGGQLVVMGRNSSGGISLGRTAGVFLRKIGRNGGGTRDERLGETAENSFLVEVKFKIKLRDICIEP
jgi:hypothetical protein